MTTTAAEVFIEEVGNKVDAAITALLEENSVATMRTRLSEVDHLLTRASTERWDGASLRTLECIKMRRTMLMGIIALRNDTPDLAVRCHQEADFSLSSYGVDDTDWSRVQNRYYWLMALTARGVGYAQRKLLYRNFEALRPLERFHAWALTYFGRMYYLIALSY